MCTLEAHIAPAGTWMSGDTTIEIISEKKKSNKNVVSNSIPFEI